MSTSIALLNPRQFSFSLPSQNPSSTIFHSFFKPKLSLIHNRFPSSNRNIPQFSRPTEITASLSMETADQNESLNHLLFVEMGVGYDQHGQDVTKAAVKACKDAISSNSIPAFSIGSIPGVSRSQMKLRIKLGVPRSLQQGLDVEKVKSVFPYGKILDVEIVDGGLICSSGVHVEELGDKNDDCYVVNAAVYVGY